MKDKRMCLNCCEIINHEGDVINHACDNLNIGKVSDIPCYRYVDGVGAVYACATTCARLPNCGRNNNIKSYLSEKESNPLGSVPPTGKDVIWAMGKDGLPSNNGDYLCLISCPDRVGGNRVFDFISWEDDNWICANDNELEEDFLVVRFWDLKDFE